MEPLRIWGLGVQVPPGAPQTTCSTRPTSEPSSVVVLWSRFRRDFLDSPRTEDILGEECHM
jgi:hypothetical protein